MFDRRFTLKGTPHEEQTFYCCFSGKIKERVHISSVSKVIEIVFLQKVLPFQSHLSREMKKTRRVLKGDIITLDTEKYTPVCVLQLHSYFHGIIAIYGIYIIKLTLFLQYV